QQVLVVRLDTRLDGSAACHRSGSYADRTEDLQLTCSESGRTSRSRGLGTRSGSVAGGWETRYGEDDGLASTASSGCSFTVARTSSNHARSHAATAAAVCADLAGS